MSFIVTSQLRMFIFMNASPTLPSPIPPTHFLSFIH